MKKLKMFAFVSIDGYSSRMNGDMDWVNIGNGKPVDQYDVSSFMESIDAVVMNRMQYILLQSYGSIWPLAGKTCYVLSNKGDAFPLKDIYGIHPLILDQTKGYNASYYIRELQAQDGEGDIWVMGDHRLTSYLLQLDMIDEMNIVRHPVLLGSGLSFIGDFGMETHWLVDEYLKYDTGAILTKYRKIIPAAATA
ncbi:dihydrofolate reductase [Bacteroidia bacterium]|nr:dihydrofolate reductase [Bacteroidia bacterium]